jgi:hypothetical protein
VESCFSMFSLIPKFAPRFNNAPTIPQLNLVYSVVINYRCCGSICSAVIDVAGSIYSVDQCCRIDLFHRYRSCQIDVVDRSVLLLSMLSDRSAPPWSDRFEALPICSSFSVASISCLF